MANANNSPFVKHPALLALFAPRPTPPLREPIARRPMPKLTGISQYLHEFVPKDELAPITKHETPFERKERIKIEKKELHEKILGERITKWDPKNNPNATKDPYKTLFVARLSYDINEDDLRSEFERYGRIRDVKLIRDKETNKSRGYAFIEFERSNDLKEAFQHADGHKFKGRRILVDVERGRTVKTWKPRKLGGGLGKTRAGPSKDKKSVQSSASTSNHNHRSSAHAHKSSSNSYAYNANHQSNQSRQSRQSHRGGASFRRKRGSQIGGSDKYRERRDKYRDRDYRDRDRRRNRDKERTKRNSRSRSRDRDRKERKRRDRDRGAIRDGINHVKKDVKVRSTHRDQDRISRKEKERSSRRHHR